MAVSGRKLSDFQGSISLGSTEDFDHTCEPCLTIGKHIEGYGFCVDCQEYLCKNCFDCHKRTKASHNHQLLDKDNFGKQSVTSKYHVECTEKCSAHKNEIIKYFCPTHKELGCNDCIILNHRTCEIDYIPDKCAGIVDSEEYRDIEKKLDRAKKEVADVMEKAGVRDKEIDICHAGIIKEILNFRKEINDRLDQIQQEIQNEADKQKSKDKKIIQMVLKECDKISSDITQLRSNLQTNKTSGHNGQLYINIKRAACKLKLNEVMKTEENLVRTNMQYSFERNTEFEKLLSKHDILGKLNLSASLLTPVKKKTFDTLTYKEDIKVSTKSDKYGCSIPGCAVLVSNKLVLADSSNTKLKVVDVHSKAVIDERTLYSKPLDIAVLHQDQMAVTLPFSKHNIFGKLNLSGSLLTPVKKKTLDTLTYKEDINITAKSGESYCCITGCALLAPNKLILADYTYRKLKVVDVQSKSVIDEQTLYSKPWDIAVLPKDQIAVTLPSRRQIVIMTTAGNIKPVRKIPVQGNCSGIAYHQDCLYVICYEPKIVFVLDTQGTIRNTISLDNDIFKSPMYIAVREGSKDIYISDDDSQCVVSITLQSDVLAVYKDNDLRGPRGMLMLDDGSLLVCSYHNGTIHHISGDLKQGQKMIDSVQMPYSICYSHHHDEVYFGGLGPRLKVYSMQ